MGRQENSPNLNTGNCDLYSNCFQSAVVFNYILKGNFSDGIQRPCELMINKNCC